MTQLLVSSDDTTGGSASGGDALPEALVRRLRRVLSDQLESTGPVSTEELTIVLRAVAREARARHVRAEQLVIMLKNVWSSLPDHPRAIDAVAQEQFRQNLITLCIKAYYGG